MFFSEVIGQAKAKKHLIRSVKEQRISHAQLFIGPPGVGKLPLALAYARFLCCTNRGEEDACGTCPSCIKISKFVHPDLHFVFPVVTGKATSDKTFSDLFIEEWRNVLVDNPYLTEDQWYKAINAENKQGFISRKESHEVLRKLSLKAYESEYKILIIWMAERMNPPAANSLLKLLEEPPDKTLFLLIADNTDQILPTILSRTQTVHLEPVDDESIRRGLKEKSEAEDALIEDVVNRANGNISMALQLVQVDETDNEYFEEFVYLMRKCYEKDIISIHKWTGKISEWGRERNKQFLTFSMRMIRENFMLNLGQKKITYLTRKERMFSDKFSPYIHPGNIAEMVSEFQLAADHIEANGFVRLVLLDLAIKMIFLLKH